MAGLAHISVIWNIHSVLEINEQPLGDGSLG